MKDKYINLLLSTIFALLLSGCVQMEPKKIYKYSELHTAVRLGQVESVKLLLTKDNIDIKDSYTETPLIDAVRNNDTRISFYLICSGAKIDVKDLNSYSLQDMAIRNNNTILLELLRSKDKKKLCSNPIKTSKDLKETTLNEEVVIVDLVHEEKKKDLFPVKHYQNNFEQKSDQSKKDHLSELLTDEELIAYQNDTPQIVKKEEIITPLDKLKKQLSLIPLQNNNLLNLDKLTFTFYNVTTIDQVFTNKLSSFIPKLVETIKSDKKIIKEIKIKVYTSSEYKNQTTIIGRFMENIKVSESRAEKIQEIILNNLGYEEKSIKDLFSSSGMSSQHLIKNSDGSENKEKSRRVEFEILTN